MERLRAQIQNIIRVARIMEKTGVRYVFTGGAVVGLLQTDPAAQDVRPTEDVDVIVAISDYPKYSELQKILRSLGLEHDMNGPNCRFSLDGLLVDVMPTDGKILGFSNSWYQYAINTSTEVFFDESLFNPDSTEHLPIRFVSPAAFIATKLEAFFDRGKEDLLMSHDLKDIIAVIDGRPELLDELKAIDSDVQRYISDSFTQLLANPNFKEAVTMNLLPDEQSQARGAIILDRARLISELNRK